MLHARCCDEQDAYAPGRDLDIILAAADPEAADKPEGLGCLVNVYPLFKAATTHFARIFGLKISASLQAMIRLLLVQSRAQVIPRWCWHMVVVL